MNPTQDDTADDPRVLEAAREYLADLESGRVPSRLSYFARHPELREAMAECFDGIELAHAAGIALRPPSAAPQPGKPLGDFQIVRELGRGGMGIVYEAIQLSLGRRVALKVLPFAAALDTKQLQRFKTEAHAAAQLHHTNIVPVYAVGCERGMHFYAMQLIEGQSLAGVIHNLRGENGGASAPTIDFQAGSTSPPTKGPATGQRSGRSRESFRSAARIAMQVAEALEYAHDVGVVHRDIKPGNLLIDAKGGVWVTDFGLAQVTADVGLTQTGDIFGTLRYMSPEQASGRRSQVDHRTDVYSLGATLYELLALEPLFPSQDRQALLQEILNEEPRPLRKIDRSIPIELETIVLKSLAKSPEERYATAGAMAADLRRFLDERPILARRPSFVDHTRKWMRRHPSFMAASVAVLFVTALILGASTALIAREQARAQKRATEAEQRFQLARRAADEMIQMAEEELSDQPHLQGLRQRLLESALSYYQEFIELRRSDPDAQADLAATRDRVRQILDDLAVMQGSGQLFLLNEKVVLDDLELSEDQRDSLSELNKRLESQRHNMFHEFHRLSTEERNQRFLELARTNDADVSAILTPKQKSRFGQIALQWQGVAAFRDSHVARELKLNADQRERIRSIEMGFYFGKPDGFRFGPTKKDQDRTEQERKDRERREYERKFKSAMQKVEAMLKPEQLTKWKELIGEPLKGGIPYRPRNMFGPPFGGGGPPEPKGPPPDAKYPPGQRGPGGPGGPNGERGGPQP
jgi:eukaryotic-like serine/threonine-protein kinase